MVIQGFFHTINNKRKNTLFGQETRVIVSNFHEPCAKAVVRDEEGRGGEGREGERREGEGKKKTRLYSSYLSIKQRYDGATFVSMCGLWGR